MIIEIESSRIISILLYLLSLFSGEVFFYTNYAFLRSVVY